MSNDRLIAITGSVVVHLVLVGILALTLWERPEPPKMAAQKPIIQATAVDEATAMAAVHRREIEAQRKQDEAERQRKADEAEQQRQAEVERKKAESEKQRQAEVKRKQAEAEKQRQAEIKRKKVEAEKQRIAEEQRKKAEAEKQRQAELKRKKAEAEKQRIAEEKRKKEAEAKLKQQMAAEAERIAAEERAQNAQQRAREVNRYIAALQSAVQRQWQRPPGSSRDFVCKVLVKQIPSGDVVDVRVVESCGTLLLDRSVEAAVRKASPLPLPANRELFDRELVLTFVPE